MADKKDKFFINREYLLILGTDPDEAIAYLESKRAITMEPAHVIALQALKKSRLVASS
jgi:hypothetical protein